jgi:glutaminase
MQWTSDHYSRHYLPAKQEVVSIYYFKMKPERKPPTSPVLDYLEQLLNESAKIKEGAIATYIPELAKAKPDWFGICLVTATGAIYEVGDSRLPFTIQSISKPFVYGLALEDNGRTEVLKKIGMEPTGDAFNSISLEPGTGRPRNPMINAGAIATTSLIAGKSPHTRLRRLLDMFALYTGRSMAIDEAIYRSESETGHRNRAIGHMLRNFDILTSDPAPAVELYFQQCSVSVNAHDLGIMAATLANRGVNPVTGKQAIRGEYVESVLSVMGSCGMYDYAGEWIYKIGMPAKSGVAGGIIAVLPGQLGIGVFSPPLDTRGNSVRGIRVCNAISQDFDLHLLNRPSVGKFNIRMKFTGAEMNSSRVRTPAESQALRESGGSIKAYSLQGNLNFTTVEAIVRDVLEDFDATQQLILDFKRVLTINESACRLLYEILLKLSATNKPVLFTHTAHLKLVQRYFKARLGKRFEKLFQPFADNDLALEWCENRLLEKILPVRPSRRRVRVVEYELCKNFALGELKIFAAFLKRQNYKPGETIIHIGAEAREIFLLARGGVSVFVPQTGGARRRLATFSAGMVFGEMAAIDRAPRSAMIVADTEVECDVLSLENFDRLGVSHPATKIKLLKNLNLSLCHRLRKANRELSLFD